MMTYNHGLWQSVPVIMMKHNMLAVLVTSFLEEDLI